MKIHPDSVSLDSYQQMADYYFSYVDTKPFNAYYERPGTLALLPEVKGKRVLDAGCAAGWYTAWLLDHGAQVTAVDLSPNMVERTHRRVGERARILQADLNLPLDDLADASFDVVLSSLTLHYLKDWTEVLSEFRRILVPGGTLVFSVHHPFMDFTVFKRENYFLTELLEDEWNTTSGPVKVHFYRRPLSRIVTAVLEAGFLLEKLSEPMPTEEFRAAQPEVYQRLTKRPQFLFLRARKP
jgi:SAM-dependent methyltransferase